MTAHVITDGESILFRYSSFEARIFSKALVGLGVNVSLGNSNFDNGVYRIIPEIDETSFDPRYQTLGSRIEVIEAGQVRVNHPVTDKNLTVYIQERIAETYQIAKTKLDEQSPGYSDVEVATWPAMQADIVAYNADSTVVGPTMQAVIDQGTNTAAGLSALLTPKINYQGAVITARNTHVGALLALTTLVDVANYDINAGWPAEV